MSGIKLPTEMVHIKSISETEKWRCRNNKMNLIIHSL